MNPILGQWVPHPLAKTLLITENHVSTVLKGLEYFDDNVGKFVASDDENVLTVALVSHTGEDPLNPHKLYPVARCGSNR